MSNPANTPTTEPFVDRFDPYRGGYVEVGPDDDGCISLTLPSAISLTPDEARRLARSLNRCADEAAP